VKSENRSKLISRKCITPFGFTNCADAFLGPYYLLEVKPAFPSVAGKNYRHKMMFLTLL